MASLPTRMDRQQAGMVKVLAWGVLAALVWWAPHLVTGLVAVLAAGAGAVVVWAAAQPLVVTFAAGLWFGYQTARRRWRGWVT